MKTKTSINKSILTASLVAASSLTAPTLSQAAIALDDAGKVKLFGDMRFRGETDSRTNSNDVSQDRTRLRYRARIGASFKANDQWSGRIRIATGNNQNSPHINFEEPSDTANSFNMTIDNAFITYKSNDLKFNIGRAPLNFWGTSEVWWDTDRNPDSFAATYKSGGFSLSSTYATLSTGSFGAQNSRTLFYQAVYASSGDGLKFKGSIGGANMNQGDFKGTNSIKGNGPVYQGQDFVMASGMIKGDNWRLAADIGSSDADTEDQAYVLQGRYKITKNVGFRAYFYHVEAFSVLGDGDFTQDNWFSPNSGGISNFDGYRLQLDYKAAKNVGIDLRYYDGERLEDPTTLASSPSQSILKDKERTRLQLNLNVKF